MFYRKTGKSTPRLFRHTIPVVFVTNTKKRFLSDRHEAPMTRPLGRASRPRATAVVDTKHVGAFENIVEILAFSHGHQLVRPKTRQKLLVHFSVVSYTCRRYPICERTQRYRGRRIFFKRKHSPLIITGFRFVRTGFAFQFYVHVMIT